MRAPILLSVFFLLVGATRLLAGPGTQGKAEEQYLYGYLLKHDAELLERAGNIPGAVQRYYESSQVIAEAIRLNSGYQPDVAAFRLRQIERAILKLCAKGNLPIPSADAAKPVSPPATLPPPDLETLKKHYHDEVEKAIAAEQSTALKPTPVVPVESIDPGINAGRPPVDPNTAPK